MFISEIASDQWIVDRLGDHVDHKLTVKFSRNNMDLRLMCETCGEEVLKFWVND